MTKNERSDSSSVMTPNILLVSGSPRKGGNSDCIVEKLSESLTEKNPTEIVHLRDYTFSSCIGCEKCRKDKVCTGLKDGMQLLYPKIIKSLGLILVSPTHHYNITSWMKAFIDRMYCFYNFGNGVPRSWSSRLSGQERKAAIIAVCEQENKEDMGFTLEAMSRPLQAFGYKIVDELAIYGIFKKAGVREDGQIMDRIQSIAESLSLAL